MHCHGPGMPIANTKAMALVVIVMVAAAPWQAMMLIQGKLGPVLALREPK